MAGLQQPHWQTPYADLAAFITNLVGQDPGLGFSPLSPAAGMMKFPTSNKGPFSAAIRGSQFASPEGPISKFIEALRSLGGRSQQPARLLNNPSRELPFGYERGLSIGPSDKHIPREVLKDKFTQKDMDNVMEVIDTMSRYRIPGEARQLADMWNKVYNPFGFRNQ